MLKNDLKHAQFHKNAYSKHATVLLDQFHVLHSEQDKERVPTAEMRLKNKSQGTKVISREILSVFISATCPIHCDAKERSKNWKRERGERDVFSRKSVVISDLRRAIHSMKELRVIMRFETLREKNRAE